MREGVQAKGRRYLTEGRVILEHVDGSAIRGTSRGGGAVYRFGFDGSWWCTCDARSLCSHLVAAQLVCRVPMLRAVTSRPLEDTA